MRAARNAAPVAPPTAASGFAALTARNAAEAEARTLCAMLSLKQREALVLSTQGMTCAEVGQATGKSHCTIEKYLADGRAMLGVGSVVEAAVLLTRAGLV